MNGKNKFLYIVSILTLILAVGLVTLCTFWLVYPYNVTEFNEVKVLQDKVVSGSALHYEINYCKHLPITAQSTRSFVNGIIYTTDTVITNNPIGCHTVQTSINTPSEMSSGTYRLRTIWVYEVNPIRKITITKDSNEFQIVNNSQ